MKRANGHELPFSPVLAAAVALSFAVPMTQTSRASLQEELRAQWQQLEAWDGIGGTRRATCTFSSSKKTGTQLVDAKVRSDRQLTHVATRLPTGVDTRSIVSRSPQYAFVIWQVPAGSDWVLKRFTQAAVGSMESMPYEPSKHAQLVCFPLSTHQVDISRSVRLPALLRDPDFRITAHAPQPDGLVKIDFTHGHESGFLIIDPNHCSVIRTCEVRGWTRKGGEGEAFVVNSKRDYDFQEGKPPLLKSLRLTFRVPSEVGSATNLDVEFTDYSSDPVPEAEFTLSNYGLPEPAGAEVGTSRTYLWIMAAGFAFLMVGVVIRWRRSARSNH